MKYLRFRLFFLLFVSVAAIAQDSAYKAYIETYSPLAIAEQQRTGVPASIKLAQGLLESGAGNGDLCMRSNNHFGIKCKTTWTGAKVYHNDDAKGECFRSYSSAEESYKDHSDFLRANVRYAPLFELAVTDYKAWAEGLKKAGYATNPKYVAMLIKVVEENNLNHYTSLALTGQVESTEVPAGNKIAISTNQINAAPPKTVVASVAKESLPVVSNTEEIAPAESYPTGYFLINETKVCYAVAGTSLLSLATDNGITMAEILAFNEMSRIDILEKDQLIFVERKKRRGATAVYEVQQKESLWSISQKQGVRLYQLAFWNNMPQLAELQKGAKVYLQEMAPGKATAARK